VLISEVQNFYGANLMWVTFNDTDIDFACFPLWCGMFDIKGDERLASQLAHHFCRIDFGDNEECKKAQDALKSLADKFHR